MIRLCLIAILLTSCGSLDVMPDIDYDARLAPFYLQFVAIAKEYKLTFNPDRVRILKFKAELDRHAEGQCQPREFVDERNPLAPSTISWREIYISQAWTGEEKQERWLVYHESVHCVFDMEHDERFTLMSKSAPIELIEQYNADEQLRKVFEYLSESGNTTE